MPRRYTDEEKRKMRRKIYGAIIAELQRGCLIDSGDPEFIDLACDVQNEIAKRLKPKSDAANPHLTKLRYIHGD